MIRKLCVYKFLFYRFLKPKCLILTVMILICIIIIVVYLFNLTILCSAWQVSTAVNVLCELYAKGEIAGNFCHDLCVTKLVQLGSCQTQHLAKEIVFEAQWKGVKIVIKADYLELKNYDSIGLKTSFKKVQYPTIPEFVEIVANHVRINLDVSMDSKDVLTKLWSQNIDSMQSNIPAVMNSVWSLIQQNEYVLMKCFEGENVFPRVVGTCGHFYAVEYINPLNPTDWVSRLQSALKLLDFSKKLDKFHQPLHLCDIKFNHFGIDSEVNIRVLDADTAYFKSVVDKMVSSGKKCSNDADCSFWDCLSKCHSEKKICTQGVTNNNLQGICEKIFLGRSSHSVILKPFEHGLLLYSPKGNKRTLLNLLEDCAKMNYHVIQNVTYKMIEEKLRMYLKNELRQISYQE